MLTAEIKKKIKTIELKTKRVLNGALISDRSTKLKGSGFEFDQIREYEEGDDIRNIDWAGSARTDKLLVKQYLDEKNRDLIIAIDISSSVYFSSKTSNKYENITLIAYILILVAQFNKDNFGVLFFADQVYEYIPPKSDIKHFMLVLEKIFNPPVLNSTTNINCALQFLSKNLKNNALIFILSDFLDLNDYEKSLKIISLKHALIAIRCLDDFELKFPNIGLMDLIDIETGENIFINSKECKINNLIEGLIMRQNNYFIKNKISFLQISHDDFFNELVNFLKKLTV